MIHLFTWNRRKCVNGRVFPTIHTAKQIKIYTWTDLLGLSFLSLIQIYITNSHSSARLHNLVKLILYLYLLYINTCEKYDPRQERVWWWCWILTGWRAALHVLLAYDCFNTHTHQCIFKLSIFLGGADTAGFNLAWYEHPCGKKRAWWREATLTKGGSL